MSRLLDDQEFIHQLAREMKQPIATARAAVAEEANSAATAGEKRGFFLTELLGTAEWIAQQIFLPRPWQVWKAPDRQEFITSDNPVVTMFPINDDFAPGFGFNSPGVLVAVPLNSNGCLVFGGNPTGPFKEISVETLRRAN